MDHLEYMGFLVKLNKNGPYMDVPCGLSALGGGENGADEVA